ncbi:MAG: ferritin-like domain-containing protein [Myxococcales bacterium]|nr:ferritin-like domain-containing protein [Myxococcales bacterium]
MISELTRLRHSIFVALGLAVVLPACVPGTMETSATGASDSDTTDATDASTSSDTSDSGSTTVGTGSDSDGTSTTEEPTTDSSASSTTATTEPGTETDTETDTATTGEPVVCDDPQPILQLDSEEPSGFVTCASGVIHREAPVACLTAGAGNCNIKEGTCATDGDCVDGDHGLCILEGGGFSGCFCNYGCTTDDDCAEGSVCACPGVVADYSVCIPSDCVDSASCGEGALCALATQEGICGELMSSIACLGDDDGCTVDADCGEEPCYENSPQIVPWLCWPSQGVWACQAPEWCQGDCGRPLLVDEQARVAELRERCDWSFGPVAATGLDAARDEALARHWTTIAQLEHASVASFARFSLQLMALGAPPALLAETRRAMADELVHARLAFGLAQRHLGAAVGPGPLAIAGLLSGQVTRAAILEALVREACVGETLAAAEAAHARQLARDPAVRRALAQIHEDEARHAQLGWRALAWILERGDAATRAHVHATLAEAIAAASIAPPAGSPADDPQLRAHGLLDARRRHALRMAAIAEVIDRLARALRGERAAA